jgi:uncharacterized OB-fold protein
VIFPVPDPDYAPLQLFWENVAARKLTFPRCESCGEFVWYPKPKCPHCGGGHLEWTEVGGIARIFAFAQVRRALHAPYKMIAPYVPVIVIFDDAPGVRLVSRWVNQDQAAPEVGQVVEIVFADFGFPKLETNAIGPLAK